MEVCSAPPLETGLFPFSVVAPRLIRVVARLLTFTFPETDVRGWCARPPNTAGPAGVEKDTTGANRDTVLGGCSPAKTTAALSGSPIPVVFGSVSDRSGPQLVLHFSEV